MVFNLSEEQASIQKAAEEFAKVEFDREVALDCEKGGVFLHETLKETCELGFVGMHYLEEYGGQGYGSSGKCPYR
ncbi:MAG: acyl-CoA dehydrogenase family protein [Syntrophorhabdales bacterium]|jgi:alkylation response protein AidB-like acyl-CoA dehydrogenase